MTKVISFTILLTELYGFFGFCVKVFCFFCVWVFLCFLFFFFFFVGWGGGVVL